MADNIVRFTINVDGNATQGVVRIGQAAEETASKMSKFMSVAQKIRDVGLAAQAVAGLYNRLAGSVQGLKDAYNAQAVSETKLAAVMRNTMGASREEIDSILKLAAAQQKLGVVGDEVQLAGAQEMATYLEKKSSLEKLLPALNDMLAQQYGLNASQEQAANIGMMLGKVMQGQTGALSRYGYAFTEAQEKILKNGTEAQRAAVLFDVVSESVGGVNAALAQTPEGKLKQYQNDMGDLRERAGSLVTQVQSAFSGVYNLLGRLAEKVIVFFENNIESIKETIGTVATVFSKAFDFVKTTVQIVWNVFTGLLNVLQYVAPALALVGVYLVAINAKFILFTMQFYVFIVFDQSHAKIFAIFNKSDAAIEFYAFTFTVLYGVV